MFNHVPIESLPVLGTVTENKNRYYTTPEGDKFPSVTTVLSIRKKEALKKWRKTVGKDVANHISRTSATRGTHLHHICEDYLNNEDISSHKKNFLPWCLFHELKNHSLHKIDNIKLQEGALYSKKYCIAGRVDCIAEFDGKLSVIDFKSSRKTRQDSWNQDYYIQATAYSEMYEELTGEPIEQIVILCVTEDGEVQEFVKNKTDYLEPLQEAVNDWYAQSD